MTMVVNPDLTERIIPALVGVQILGFIVIAAIIVTSRSEYGSPVKTDRESDSTGKQWVPWLFGFLALLSFLRVGLAVLYIAGEGGARHSWLNPIAGTAMGCFFLWLAILAGRSVSRGRSAD
jgi:hypothetical protein